MPIGMRALHAPRAVLAAFSALALAACQEQDVGEPCDLDVLAGSPLVPIDQPALDAGGQAVPGVACTTEAYLADFFRSGALECDNLICIRSATGAACSDPALAPTWPKDVRKYCSRPCVSDQDCENGRIHLVCRPIVLDSGYLTFLQQCAANPGRIDPVYGPCPPPDEVASRLALLGGVPSSNYCATPP